MTFRSKISFTVLVGPFILLGAIVATNKNLAISSAPTWLLYLVIALDSVCYLALATLCASIETQGWEQCNKRRRAIAKIYNDPSASLDVDEELLDKTQDGYKMYTAYLLSYILIFLAFGFTAALILASVVPAPSVTSPH